MKLYALFLNRLTAAALLLVAVCFWSLTAAAASECGIGLRTGAAPTVDGLEGASEWTDASVLSSADPCLGQLLDVGSVPRDVTVKSKRYVRGGQYFLGFLFEVHDTSSPGVVSGERIVMHFNRVIDADKYLNTGEDARFTVAHRWATPGVLPAWCVGGTTADCVTVDTSSNTFSSLQHPVADSSCPAPGSEDPAYVKWGSRAGFASVVVAIRKGVTGGGYRAEIEVPVNFVTGQAINNTDLPKDIGVAFGVINDWGAAGAGCSTGFSTSCGAGLSFPHELPETNDANPVDATCDVGWVTPKQWGVGYLNSPPEDVTISRTPDWWNSSDIAAYECDPNAPGYTYYPTKPCKITIRATLHNNGATTRRKVVYLWAAHGTGDPDPYNFIDLQDVVLQPGLNTINSTLWAGMPTGQANHPCLRVYVLPESLSASDEALMRGIATSGQVSRASLLTVVADTGIGDQNWAQKNLSRHDTLTTCPAAGCEIGMRGPIRIEFISSAMAATDAAANSKMPNSGADWERYAKDHLIVQVRTVAYRDAKGRHKRRYNFMEDFGGVIQMFPLAMVQKSSEVPIEFNVANGSDSTMHVMVLADTLVPPGAPGVRVVLPTKELILPPHSTQTVRGAVAPSKENCPPKCCPCKDPKEPSCKRHQHKDCDKEWDNWDKHHSHCPVGCCPCNEHEPPCSPFSKKPCKDDREHNKDRHDDHDKDHR